MLLLSLSLITVVAWGDCPRGEVLCEGECGLFVDIDNDGICDHSQPAPKDRNSNTTDQVTEEEIQEDKYGLETIAANDIALSVKTGTQEQQGRIYHLLPISLFLTSLYLISHFLSKKKIISIADHRKIWNILLLISFLISAILGILLVVKINFGTVIPLPFNTLFWHVEIGIAMTAISVFHILWHWAYFKNMFKIKK